VLLPAAVLLAAAFLLFANTFGHTWTMDDLPVIVNNPDIRSLEGFLRDSYPGRPLRELTYLLDYSLFELDPTGYHIQNIFWHGLNCYLLLLLVTAITGKKAVAWTAALLFLVHPVHVEVVANISHRKDSLALTFILLALLAYLRASHKFPRSLPWLLVSLSAWVVAMMAKQHAVALPLIICIYELACIPEERCILFRNRELARWLLVGASTGLVVWIVRLESNSSFKAAAAQFLAKTADFGQLSINDYQTMIMKSMVFMLGKFVYPVSLSMEYSFAVPASLLDPWVIAAMVLIYAGGIALWQSWKHDRLAFFALAWTMIFLVPSSNLFWPSAYFAADRYIYTPSVGLCILTALLLEKSLDKARPVYALVLVTIVAGLSVLTWEQNKVWQSQFTLYQHILNTNPMSSAGLIGLGAAYQDRGELAEALACYEKAQKKFPDNALVYNHMGTIHMLNNDLGRASACFTKAIALNPDFADAHNNLGLVYETLGQQEKALAALQKSLYLNPRNNKAYTNLGMLYERMGCYDDAEKMHRRAIEECGAYADAHYNLGVSLCKSGKLVQAREEFCNAIKLDPDHPDALFNAALLAIKLGDGVTAVTTLPLLQKLDKGLAVELEKELLSRHLL
jgi:tetratricopeptide (TPR) repeat protein